MMQGSFVVKVLGAGEVDVPVRDNQRKLVVHWVFLGGVGQFIGKRLHAERMKNIGHAAQPPDADIGPRLPTLGAVVGNVEGNVSPAVVDLVLAGVENFRVGGGGASLKYRALQPGR